MNYEQIYFPIMKIKRAECLALKELSVECKQGIIPLFYPEPTKFLETKENHRRTEEIFVQNLNMVSDSWEDRPIFLDLDLVYDTIPAFNNIDMIEILTDNISQLGLNVIHVINIKNDGRKPILNFEEIANGEICFRVNPLIVSSSNIKTAVDTLLNGLDIDASDADIILDFSYITGRLSNIPQQIQKLPYLKEWRNFAVVSGAFPKDLSEFKVGQHLKPRHDWTSWQNMINTREKLNRVPIFGDYTIQHPIYHTPPPRINFSASIRYTFEDNWVIMRGEGVFNDGGPGFDQYLANAQLLCERSEFCGKDYSYGDSFIWDKSRQEEHPGNAEQWIRAGLNHHITHVVNQISSFV